MLHDDGTEIVLAVWFAETMIPDRPPSSTALDCEVGRPEKCQPDH